MKCHRRVNMFTPETFVLCSRFELFKAHCNFWLYWTSDTLQECLVENYFRPRQNLKNHDSPNVGDVIQCIVENHYLAYLVVTAKTEAPYHITVQQTYLSEAISHEVLSGRELTDQHPITAITGLLERLNNLEGRGRFLSDWDAETGLPTTNPAENPYPYKAGDYYIVSNISETTNYRPDGDEYVHDVPSVTVETSDVAVNDTYMYDGTVWILRKDSEPKIPIDVALSLTSENPVQNKVITAALNTKQDILTAGANISISGTTISATYEYVLTKQKILTALGYTPYDSSNPDGFISGITSSDVITALGYTPYSTANPAGYITGYTVTQTDVTTALGYMPQVPLVSGQNIRTFNGTSLLGQGDIQVSVGNSMRNVGDIFMTKRTDTELAGAVECDGATYDTNDFLGLESVETLLANGKLDYVSLSDYATAISTKGWCDKIGWNGTGTTAFRVPTLTPHIVQTNNLSIVGQTAKLDIGSNVDALTKILVGTDAVTNGLISNWTAGVKTNVEKIQGAYADTSDTAQLRVMIQLATGATDEALETCTGVLADVADLKLDKAEKDLSNITATGKETVVSWGMPDWSAVIDFSGQNSYQAPCDGYIYSFDRIYDWNLYDTDGTTLIQSQISINGYEWGGAMTPIGKGQYCKLGSGSTYKFIPCKGVSNA